MMYIKDFYNKIIKILIIIDFDNNKLFKYSINDINFILNNIKKSILTYIHYILFYIFFIYFLIL